MGQRMTPARLAYLQRRADALKGRAGYEAALQRLRDARHEMLREELADG